jgi:hypothetical protein
MLEPASIAIWKKKKHIVALAVAVWLTNAAFLIHGKSSQSPLPEETPNA